MVFKNPYWSKVTKIQMLQNWIIVHSLLYYEFDTSIVEDRTYDMNEVQLAKLMKKYPKSASMSKYAYAFKGFDGSTGFDIPRKLTKEHKEYFLGIINFILKNQKEKSL